jgi:hypothetical protein
VSPQIILFYETNVKEEKLNKHINEIKRFYEHAKKVATISQNGGNCCGHLF